MIKRLGLQVKISAVILIPFLLLLLIYSSINIILVNAEASKQANEFLLESVISASYKAKEILKESQYYLENLSSSVSSLYDANITGGRASYSNVVYNFASKMPSNITGIACLFNKNTVDEDINFINDRVYSGVEGQFVLYLVKTESTIIAQPIQNLNSEYLNKALSTKKPTVSPVYVFPINGKDTLVFSIAVPVLNKNNSILGLIVADITLDTISRILQTIKPYPESVAVVFDSFGNLVYNVGSQEGLGKNVYDIYPYYSNYDMIDNIKRFQTISFQTRSAHYGKKASFVVTPIPIVDGYNWGLELVVPNDIILSSVEVIKNTMILSTLLIIIITCILTPFIIKKNVVGVISHLSKNMLSMSNGDLTIPAPTQFLNNNDEWGDISRSWDVAMNKFNEVINRVSTASEYVSNAASEVRQGNVDLSLRTENQVANLEETASSMNEIASTIKESTDNVAQSTNMVSDAKVYLDRAGSIVEDSVNKMDDVYEASSRIMDITKLIENIAFQTNILALNASVEAARAGDQGRGFAVVASEVRNLALNTQDSVKNITDLINDSNEKIKLAADSVKDSKSIFAELSAKMDLVSQYMEQINTTAQEQQAGVSQINSAINQMEGSLQQNAALVEEATAASESLLSEARDLTKAISYFKTTR